MHSLEKGLGRRTCTQDYLRLADNEDPVHTRAAVGLAVVRVGSGGVELLLEEFAGLADLIVDHGDGFLADAGRDALLVEDDVVGAGLIVDPLDGVTRADSELLGNEGKQAGVASHKHLLRLGGIGGARNDARRHAGGQAGGASHGLTASAAVLAHDDRVKVGVEIDPVEGRGEGRLDVPLEAACHGRDALDAGGARAAGVAGGAPRSGEEGEELTLAVDFELEVEVDGSAEFRIDWNSVLHL